MDRAGEAAKPYGPEDELKDLAKIVSAMKKLTPAGRRWIRDFLAEEVAAIDEATAVVDVEPKDVK